MRRLFVRAVAFLSLGCGCSGDGPLSIPEIRELQAARARWVASPVRTAYRFEVLQSCFCPPEISRWNTVTVVNDVITDVRATESGEVVSPERRSSYLTVEEMFAALNVRESEFIDDVTFRFDPQYGYPVEIISVPPPDVLDGGGGIFARNLVPLPIP